jgi:acetyl esterase/lipase
LDERPGFQAVMTIGPAQRLLRVSSRLLERVSVLMADMDLSRRIVYRVEGRSEAVAPRTLVYKRDNNAEVLLDLYAPPDLPRPTRLPALFFVHGGPIPPEMTPPREWGVFKAYGELAAASGLAGVVFNHRLHAPTAYPVAEADTIAAIDFVRDNAQEFGVDGDRIGIWAFSGGGPLLSWCLRERPAFLRCLLAFYALLDLRHLVPPDSDPDRKARANAYSPVACLKDSLPGLPMFIARAGRDSATINDSIDLFVREALAANATLDLAAHPNGQHGFDILDDDERSREIIARAIGFARTHLSIAVSTSA